MLALEREQRLSTSLMDRLNTLWFMFWVWSASPPDDDNARSHSSLILTEFLAKNETEDIAQPPYSPDLAPCEFFLFPKLKYPLRVTRHELIEAIKRNSLKFVLSQKGPILKAIIVLKYIKMFFFYPVRVKFDQMVHLYIYIYKWKNENIKIKKQIYFSNNATILSHASL